MHCVKVITLCFLTLCASVGNKRFQHCLMHGVTMKAKRICMSKRKKTHTLLQHVMYQNDGAQHREV